ncbi:MAG: hypothetical protein JNL21_22625 [Myxococcales bacterium]|nr:hypothetical protein [Myxococcales bacterium]
MRPRSSVLPASLLVTLIACGDEAQQSEDFTESKKLTLKEGPELVTCRVEKGTGDDVFFRVDRVLCKLAPKNDFPLQPSSVHVAVASAKGHAGDAEVGADESEIAKVYGDSYPLDVEISATYSETEAAGLVGFGNSGFFKTFQSRHGFVAPTAEPVSVRFPFDLWPVEIRAKAASFSGGLDPFSIDLSPMKTSSGEGSLGVEARLGTISQGAKRYSLVPVTRGTKTLSGKAKIGDKEVAITLTGPGAYIVENDGLRGATQADLEDFSGGPAFASCWTAPSAEADMVDVICRRDEVAGLSIAKLETLVGDEEATAVAGAVLEASEATVATVAASQLPLTIWARATLAKPEIVGIPEWQAALPFTVPVVVAAEASATTPVAATLPFDVWPITVDAAGGSFLCDLDAYSVPLGVEWGAASLIKVEGQSTPYVNEGETTTFYVVADSRVESLACKGLIVTNSGEVTEGIDVTLVRGGTYEIGQKTVQPGG